VQAIRLQSNVKYTFQKNAQAEETKTICCTDSFMHCVSVQGAVQCHVWEVQIRLGKWLCIFGSLQAIKLEQRLAYIPNDSRKPGKKNSLQHALVVGRFGCGV